METKEKVDVARLGQAVCLMFEDINPLAKIKVLEYMGGKGLPIEDAVAGVITIGNAEKLTKVLVAIRDNKIADLSSPPPRESRPQPNVIDVKPEPAAVTTTTTNRSITPAQGKSKRQGMKEMWESMQEAMSQEDEEVESIASRVIEERFKPMLLEALNNGCFPDKRIQEMIDRTPPKTDDELMKTMIDESFRSGVGKVVAGEVKAGAKVLLPPLQPVCPYFVQTPMADDIEYHIDSGQHPTVRPDDQAGDSGAGWSDADEVRRWHPSILYEARTGLDR